MKKRLITSGILLLATLASQAQAPPPPPQGGNAPIDQGIVFLAIIAIAYGIYRKNKLAFR